MIKKVTTFILCAGISGVLLAAQEKEEETKELGGAGSISIGMMWLDLEPLKEIVEDDLNRTGFGFDNNRFMTVGIMGYGGNRTNGFRVGWNGLFGYNTMYSDSWRSISNDSAYITNHPDSLVDSIVQLHNIIAHGGLLIERSFNIYKNCHIYFGGTLGGGAIVSFADQRLAGDAFHRIDDNDNDWDDEDHDGKNDNVNNKDTLSDDRVAVAPLWAFDIHGGMTHSLTKWMHIGLDFSAIMYYSSSGFSYRQGSFLSINPGVKIRLVFGNSV